LSTRYFHIGNADAMNSLPHFFAMATAAVFAWTGSASLAIQTPADQSEPVSFARQVRPLLAANCFGCHQGARREGGYDMTGFEGLRTGGESGLPAIVPGQTEDSYLLELVTGHEGEPPEMPPPGSNAEYLSEDEVQLIRRWIAEGAANDQPREAVMWDSGNPPQYSRQPNVTSLDFSPDGKWLAVNGFHEVLLFDADQLQDGTPARRLIGLSARIESLKFSPDATRLAACGGNPAEFGEVQIWDVASGELQLSKTVSQDTVYGIDWSPDGSRVAFGCTDNSVRAVDAGTGEQVFYQGAHEDWIRDTVFSLDGSRLVSVGRDMTCKLYEVPVQRFVDNVTSITPGVLKGGIASVARHPQRDEVVIGGADGIPKVYRMDRITKRVIGDDANLVRLLPELPGRIHDVAVANDGTRIAAVSSLNGRGALRVYSWEFDSSVPEDLRAILAKQPLQWNPGERERIEAWHRDGVRTVAAAEVAASGLYAVAFHPDGRQLAAAGADGIIRVYETESGRLLQQLQPVTITRDGNAQETVDWRFPTDSAAPQPLPATRPLPAAGEVTGMEVHPARIQFRSPTEYVQLVIRGTTADPAIQRDLSQVATIRVDESIVTAAGSLVQPVAAGTTRLIVEWGDFSVVVPVEVEMPSTWRPEFRRDVNPILTRLGCNAGTCHGSADGKMGFKLSLRGYDPVFDLRALTDDMGSRRVNLASPDDSLMLAKPSATVPHTGGKLLDRHDKYYTVIREWIRNGARLDEDAPRVVSLELFPQNPVLGVAGDRQQMRLVATWSDGSSRDVTREGFIEVGGLETARVVEQSAVEALRRGETPILARYEGAYTATTLTVMGQREGFAWHEPETWTRIDRMVADKWRRMKIRPAGLGSDYEFMRRVYLDLTGLPPTADEVRKFAADPRPTRDKRDALIDELLGCDSFVEHWSNKWADLLQVNRKYLGDPGARSFRDWIRDQVRGNRPWDEFARDILTASGSNRDNPAAAWMKIHRTPVDTMESTTHLFLAIRFNCNKCHDHPFERWTQDQYFETAAWFAEVSLKKDPASGDQKIGGTAVEGATPLYEIVGDEASGKLIHDRTGETVAPAFPFDCQYDVAPGATRRQRLAAWVSSPDNPYFATSLVNRLWGYLLGSGLIEPLDDIRAGNPATNPELLEYLRAEFVASDFDIQHVLRLICQSRTYQLSIETNEFNADDSVNYSHAMARRLPAEVLFDTIHFVTGSPLQIPGVPAGTRAAALPDSGVKLPSGFLATLGRPARESVCECERSSDLQLGSVLALVSGPDVSRAINDPDSELARLVARQPDDRQLINELYLRILNRPASDEEIDLALTAWDSLAGDHETLVRQRDERQKHVQQQLPQLEQERLKAIESTTQELQQAIRQRDPGLLQKEAAREQAIAETRAALEQYESGPLGFAAWLDRQRTAIHWHPLAVSRLDSAVDRGYTLLEDRSVLLDAKPGKDIYTVYCQTDLTGVASLRLELLPHDSLNSRGPGLAENGNLVLTELEVAVARPDQPDQWQTVEFDSVLANFQQGSYPVKNAIDGKLDNQDGWALMGNLGQPNWATLQLKAPLGFAAGTMLRIRLHQQYDQNHQIGRFRISLSRNHDIGLGLCESLLGELAKPADQRSDDVQARLRQAFRQSDARFRELETAAGQAARPLSIDPEIVRLREKLQRVRQPIPEDARLVQLNLDVQSSERQLGNARLTATQDLAWALINSPSFLFNR
jgi:WD40 repeat protein